MVTAGATQSQNPPPVHLDLEAELTRFDVPRRRHDAMPRYPSERNFPDGLGPAPSQQGCQAATTVTSNDAQHEVTWPDIGERCRKYLGSAAVALLLGLSSAQAAELAGGPIDGGFVQDTAVCYFFNAGDGFVTLGNARITGLNGSAIPLTVNECGAVFPAVLPNGHSCGIAGKVSNNTIYSCQASVMPSKRDVRGVLEMRDSSGVTLQNIVLR
jgi:hypothetical protein